MGRRWLHAMLGLSAALALAGCGRAPEPPAVAATPPKSAAPAPAPAAVAPESAAVVPPAGDVDPYAFTVDIDLSDAAAKLLSRNKETIKIAVYYYGMPKPGAPEGLVDDEMGQIFAGEAEAEIPGAPGSVRIDGKGVERDKLAYLEGELQANVNVFSGRRSSPDNLLTCGLFDDAIRLAHARPIKIHCALIPER